MTHNELIITGKIVNVENPEANKKANSLFSVENTAGHAMRAKLRLIKATA